AWTIPLWLLILIDWLSPKINPDKPKAIISDVYYDAILYSLAFLQFLIISLLLIYASQLQWDSINAIVTSLLNLTAMRILVGTSSGSSAIIVAHELIHRHQQHQRLLGRLLLYTVCYEHFVIAHIRGHHQSVATPEDIATARLGESFKSYWKRVYIAHFKYAWNSEKKRLQKIKSPTIFANLVLQGLMIEIMLVILIIAVFGWVAAFIFLYQALAGVRLLETINYFQHWGLEQGKAGNTLAWVNQSSFTEYALIGLSNHISHHQSAVTSYHKLPYSELGAKMPYGYFVTNLWVKWNNDSYRQVSSTILKNYRP
ncbi:MAG: fatty acid desaturase, partial [Methylococcaceae bacterium]|nr:fatty acid desaturase [Methylococcaceae bacterium]